MTDVLRLSWAIARSGWRASWNRGFRFSRLKSGLIALVLQALFFLMIARRAPAMAPQASTEGFAGVMALMSLQMAWFGMMYGFSRGQFQLYQGLLVPLFQISPARPLGFLLGRVIEALPTRLWSTALWAWVYSGMIPGPSRLGIASVLAAVGLLVGMVAHLSGLLLLAFWGRYSPRTMRNGLLFFGTATLALATWAIIYLAQGGTVTDLALLMRQYRLIVFGAVVALTGVPGLLLLIALGVRPTAVEELYRRGLYQVIELGESDIDRPGRSLWLPFGRGVMRAVLSREWLELTRSRVARVQAMIWVAGTVGVYVAGRSMEGQPMERLIQYVGALSLLAWFMAFGHWVVRVFEKERRTMVLYRLAAVPAPRLLLAKFTSVFLPSALLVSASTTIGSLAARLTPTEALTVLWWSLSGLAAGVIGGFGAAAATADQGEIEEQSEALPARGDDSAAQTAGGNSAWWSLARTGALVVSTALPMWMGAGQPGLPFTIPPVVLGTVCALLPSGLLLLGYRLMVSAWHRSG